MSGGPYAIGFDRTDLFLKQLPEFLSQRELRTLIDAKNACVSGSQLPPFASGHPLLKDYFATVSADLTSSRVPDGRVILCYVEGTGRASYTIHFIACGRNTKVFREQHMASFP